MAHEVFISHSTKDKLTADAICSIFENNGIRCWIAPRDIVPGMEWVDSIIDGISASRIMILVLSSNSNTSQQVKREVEQAVNEDVIIIPFRIENIELSKSFKYYLSGTHWLDALTPPIESHIKELLETVKQLLPISTLNRVQEEELAAQKKVAQEQLEQEKVAQVEATQELEHQKLEQEKLVIQQRVELEKLAQQKEAAQKKAVKEKLEQKEAAQEYIEKKNRSFSLTHPKKWLRRLIWAGILLVVGAGLELFDTTSITGKTNPKEATSISSDSEQAIKHYELKDGLVKDTDTNLMWLRFAHGQSWANDRVVGNIKTVDWETAFKVVKAFNKKGGYGGYRDWRLPTIEELKTLIDKNKGKEGSYIDADTFPNNDNDVVKFWSSSADESYNGDAYFVEFGRGNDGYSGKDNDYAIRLVRNVKSK